MGMCGTTTTTNTSQNSSQQGVFDPTSMGTYQGLQGNVGNVLTGFMQSPFSSPYYTAAQNQLFGQASQMGQQNFANIAANMNRGYNIGNFGAYQASEAAKGSRFTSYLQSQAQNQLLGNFMGLQLGATQAAQSYRPLQTGQTGSMTGQQTTSQSGGWLPQLLGAGLSAGLGFATGGLSGMAGALGIPGISGSRGSATNFFRPPAPGAGDPSSWQLASSQPFSMMSGMPSYMGYNPSGYNPFTNFSPVNRLPGSGF